MNIVVSSCAKLCRYPPTTSCHLLGGLRQQQHPVVDHVKRNTSVLIQPHPSAKRFLPKNKFSVDQIHFQNAQLQLLYMVNVHATVIEKQREIVLIGQLTDSLPECVCIGLLSNWLWRHKETIERAGVLFGLLKCSRQH